MSLAAYGRLLRDRKDVLDTLKADGHVPAAVDPALFERGAVRATVERLHPALLDVEVVAARWELPNVRTLTLRPRGRALPSSLPGQYVTVHVELDGVRTSRPQSLSSVPGADQAFEITVKRKPGGFVSRYLVDGVRVGDVLRISAPEGDLVHEPLRDGERLVFVAGGSGVTPFAPMIEHALATRPGTELRLLHAARNVDELIFRERLAALVAAHGARFAISTVLSDAPVEWSGARGHVTAPLIARAVQPWAPAEATYFVCGPPAMVEHVAAELRALGVPAARVRSETSAIDDIRSTAAWPGGIREDQRFLVQLAGRDRAVDVAPGETLLNALERRGVVLPAHCRSGTCGTCRSRLVRGAVVSSNDRGQRPSDAAAGYIYPCVSYPVTDVVIHAPQPNAR